MTRLGTQSLQLAGTTSLPVPVEGVVDLDHDGHAEIALQITHGASTAFSSIVRLVGNQLTQLRGADGNVVQLASGGSVTHVGVWGCRPTPAGSSWQLWQWEGSSDAANGDAAMYSGTETLSVMRDGTLVTVSRTSFTDQRPPAAGCGSLHV